MPSDEVFVGRVLVERHHLDPSGASVLVEPALHSGAFLLRHCTHFPILDDRHRARDGVPCLPGAGRAVKDQIQGVD